MYLVQYLIDWFSLKLNRVKGWDLVFLVALATPVTASAQERITVWNSTYNEPNMLQVLQLALDHTQVPGQPYQLVPTMLMEQGRVMRELESNQRVDIAAFAPTPEREQKAIAVRIPVARGLLGYRVCLVRAGEEDAYADIHTLKDWIHRGLRIGQGTHWPDTAILEFNGIKVVKSVRYQPLFPMLEKGRFDCFSRSLNEVMGELAREKSRKLALERHLLFVYRLPTFFFVSPQKPELAKRIEKGLRMAIKDGSFEALFNKLYANTFKQVGIKNRHVIQLKNPYLSDKTRAIEADAALWWNPSL